MRPSSAAEAPTTPSEPTIAASTNSPDWSVTTKDTTAVLVLYFLVCFEQNGVLLVRGDLEKRLKPLKIVLAKLGQQTILHGALPWLRREREELSGIGALDRVR